MSNSKKDIAIADLRTFLEDAYPIGKVTAIESITCDEEELLRSAGSLPDAHQLSADELLSSFRVSTESTEYFLKRISAWVEADQLERIEHFLNWTGARKLDLCPALIQTRTGQSHVRLGVQRFQLFEYIEQEKRHLWMKPEMSVDDCALEGALLARMHVAGYQYLAEFDVCASTFSPAGPMTFEWTTNSPFKELWDSLFEHIYSTSTHEHAILQQVRHSNYPLRSACGLVMHNVSFGNPEKLLTLVHGDFHPGNVLFSRDENDRKTGFIVDFDHLRFEHPFYDIGYALIMSARKFASNLNFSESSSYALQRIDWLLARAFIEGYLGTLRATPDTSGRVKSLESALMATDAALLSYCMQLSCYLIMAWAAEKVKSVPREFSEIYSGVLELAYNLLCDNSFCYAENLWKSQ